MTAMEVAQKLSKISSLKKEIRAKEQALNELMTQATHITSILSHAKVFTDSSSSAPENYAIRSYELRLDMEEGMDALVSELDECLRMINTVREPLIRSILIDYHINLLNVTQLCEKYHYSERQIYNLRMRGYKFIADHFH